jgi:membrane-associated phospholipid phosphatase
VCGIAFVGLTVAVAAHPEPFGLDRPATRIAEEVRTSWLTSILEVVTRVGSSPWLVAIALVVGTAVLVVRRDALPGAWLLAEYVGAVAMYQGLKAVLDRPRPPGGLVEATGTAFPSGHATQGIAFFGLLAAILLGLLPRRVGVVAAVAVAAFGVLSGLSRVYLGVHWATDVAGGFLLGGAWLAVVLLVRTRYAERGASRPPQRAGDPAPGEPPPRSALEGR